MLVRVFTNSLIRGGLTKMAKGCPSLKIPRTFGAGRVKMAFPKVHGTPWEDPFPKGMPLAWGGKSKNGLGKSKNGLGKSKDGLGKSKMASGRVKMLSGRVKMASGRVKMLFPKVHGTPREDPFPKGMPLAWGGKVKMALGK